MKKVSKYENLKKRAREVLEPTCGQLVLNTGKQLHGMIKKSKNDFIIEKNPDTITVSADSVNHFLPYDIKQMTRESLGSTTWVFCFFLVSLFYILWFKMLKVHQQKMGFYLVMKLMTS